MKEIYLNKYRTYYHFNNQLSVYLHVKDQKNVLSQLKLNTCNVNAIQQILGKQEIIF